jgi:hypothetical protein
VKGADHHLGRIHEAVVQARKRTGFQSDGPVRFFQLTSKAGPVVSDPWKGEEAVLDVAKEKGPGLQVLDRLSLGVQHRLYALDDVAATGHEGVEKLEMCPKRHLAGPRSGGPPFGREERMEGHASKGFVTHSVSEHPRSSDPASTSYECGA